MGIHHRTAAALVFFASLATGGSAAADVFKRVDPDGSVTYSDEVAPDADALELYNSAGIAPAPPANGPEAVAFERRRDVRIRRTAILDRLAQARIELDVARATLAGGVDAVDSTVGPDQLAGGAGLVAAFASVNGGASAVRPTASAGGGAGSPRSTTGGNAGLDAAGAGLTPTGGLGAPGLGAGATGGLTISGTSRTATGGAGNRVAAAQPRAFARYTEKVEYLAAEVARREAEIASLTAALESLR